MTKTDLIAQVAANTEMSKKSAEMAVNAAFEALGKAMAEGEKISISGFGTFEVRERAERQGINPRTREAITIAGQGSEGHPVRENPSPPEPLGPAAFLIEEQPLRHAYGVPPPLIGEALAYRKALPLRQRLPSIGELSSDSETERLIQGV